MGVAYEQDIWKITLKRTELLTALLTVAYRSTDADSKCRTLKTLWSAFVAYHDDEASSKIVRLFSCRIAFEIKLTACNLLKLEPHVYK